MARDLEAENRRLRAEVDELLEERRQRQEQDEIVSGWLPTDWRLTPTERRIILTFARRPMNYYSRAHIVGIAGLQDAKENYASVLISHLRKKLAKHDIRITVTNGIGYRLAPESMGKLKAEMANGAALELRRIDAAMRARLRDIENIKSAAQPYIAI